MHPVDAPVRVGEITALAITQPPERDAPAVGSAVGADHPDMPPSAPPVVEATTSKQVLAKVSRIGTWMTQWRAVILAIRDAAVSAQQVSKMIVLYLFVVAGAAAHVASLSLAQIRFDDPLRIYAASTGLDWLRLRWLAILRLMIPVVIVAGSLWGAGNIPNNFQDLGVALLAGYSADSIFRSSVARLASNSTKG